MGDTKTTLTWLLRDEVSGPAHKIDGALGAAEKRAGSAGGLFGKLGGALGGIVNPATLAVGAVGALVGGIGLAIKSAGDEQKNIEKLNAALVASVPGWDGNTAAIEGLIAKREDLAFSDDDLRDSLAVLVTSTKDVTEAQNLQAIAMDLARFKGIDLATASTAVAKASQGSTKEIKALGLELDDTATASDNLLAIQKATAGQAEGYAKTMGGKWEAFNNKLGDVVETIGGALIPVVEGIMDFLLGTAIPAFGQLADILGPVLTPIVGLLGTAFQIVGDGIKWFVEHVIGPAIDVIKGLIGFVKDALKFLGILHDEPIPAAPLGAGTGGLPPDMRASGGPVLPGRRYTVGEAGAETLVMGASGGYVIPGGGAGSGGAGAPVVIALQLDGREVARVVDRHLYYAARSAPPLSY